MTCTFSVSVADDHGATDVGLAAPREPAYGSGVVSGRGSRPTCLPLGTADLDGTRVNDDLRPWRKQTPQYRVPGREPVVVRPEAAGQNVGVQVTLPDGIVVLAQGRLGVVSSERPRQPDFALYLDGRWRDDREVVWPFRMIDWPDFGLPDDEGELFGAIVDLDRRARTGELVEIACYGGVGRTGTVLACLSVMAGIASSEAVGWVRDHYYPSAVETPDQEQLIYRFSQTPPPQETAGIRIMFSTIHEPLDDVRTLPEAGTCDGGLPTL